MAGPDDNDRKRKNPWGGGGNSGGPPRPPQGPWRGPGQGGNEPPDLDRILQQMQESLRDILPGNMNGKALVLLVLLGLTLLWLASGFFMIKPGEHGVIQRFGAWNRTKVDEGLGYKLPFPIETLTKVNVSQVRRMEIGFTDSGMRGGVESRQSLPTESLMLTSDRNIVDINVAVQWNIKSAENFLFNIQDQEGTIKKVAESAIREVVGQMEMFPVITTEQAQVADKAAAIIQENLDEYNSGVHIDQVALQKAEVHPDVQEAFQDVQSAKQDAEDTQNIAQAYREDILPKARGQATQILQQAEAYRQSQIAKAKGDADRFKSIYTAYLSGKDVTKERIFIETMEDVLKNAEKIIMDSNGAKSGVVPYLPLNALGVRADRTDEGNLKP